MTVTFCYIFLSLVFLLSERGVGGWQLTCRKQPLLPIPLGTKNQSKAVYREHGPVRHLLVCCATERWSMKNWFTMRFHLIDPQRPQIFKKQPMLIDVAIDWSSHRLWKLFLRRRGYHMEGKVLFICKCLSLGNHSWIGLDRWQITCVQSEDTNAIIFPLPPSLYVHYNPVNPM